jgi:hypothetical protein
MPADRLLFRERQVADGGDLYFPAHNGLVAGSRTPLIVAHSGESDHPFQGMTTSVARGEGRRWISLLISVFAASQSMTLFPDRHTETLQVVTCPHQKPLAPIVAFRRWIAKAIANASTRKVE